MIYSRAASRPSSAHKRAFYNVKLLDIQEARSTLTSVKKVDNMVFKKEQSKNN
jgi:hypothetical protein